MNPREVIRFRLCVASCLALLLGDLPRVDASEQRIPLQRNWNLVAFQVLPFNSDPRAVFETIGGSFLSAWTFDAHTQRWQAVFGESVREDATLINELEPVRMSEIQLGRGYLIHVSADVADWRLAGTTPVSGLPVSAAPGWNLVGIPVGGNAEVGELTLSDVLPADRNGPLLFVSWESDLQRFGPVTAVEQALTDFDPNRAFWVFTEESTVLLSRFISAPHRFILEKQRPAF